MSSYNKPICKVCRDAGKSEAEYQSHWVRSKSGKVTCPTLLSQSCRSCGKSGHTVKYCKAVMFVSSKSVTTTEKKEPVNKQLYNRYAVLEEDENEEQPQVVVDTPKVITYLDILSKEAPQPHTVVHLKDLKSSVKNLVPIKLKHSWASETSSETTECDEPEFNDSDTDEEEPSFARPKPSQMRSFSQSVIPIF